MQSEKMEENMETLWFPFLPSPSPKFQRLGSSPGFSTSASPYPGSRRLVLPEVWWFLDFFHELWRDVNKNPSQMPQFFPCHRQKFISIQLVASCAAECCKFLQSLMLCALPVASSSATLNFWASSLKNRHQQTYHQKNPTDRDAMYIFRYMFMYSSVYIYVYTSIYTKIYLCINILYICTVNKKIYMSLCIYIYTRMYRSMYIPMCIINLDIDIYFSIIIYMK